MTATKTPAFHKPPLFTRQQLIALLLPGEQRRLMERGRFGCCHRFLRNGNEMHLDT